MRVLNDHDRRVIPLYSKPEDRFRAANWQANQWAAIARSAYKIGDVAWARRSNGQAGMALILDVMAHRHWRDPNRWTAFYKVRFKGRRGWQNLFSYVGPRDLEKGFWLHAQQMTAVRIGGELDRRMREWIR